MLSGCSGISQNGSTTTIGSPPYTQGSGKETTDTRTLATFHEIHVSNGMTVTVASGSSPSVAVTIDDNLVPMVKTAVANGVLSISVEGSLQTHLKLKAAVTASDKIDSLTVDGGSTLDIENIDASSFTATVGGGSTVHAGGKATDLTLTVGAGSTGDFRNVATELSRVDVSGGSTAHIKVHNMAIGKCLQGSTTVLHGTPSVQSIINDTSSTVKVE
jgi:hypothetical protein